MDAKEFTKLAAGLKLSSEQIEMARRVLVGGESRANVAASARDPSRVSKVLYGRLQNALAKILGLKLEQEGVPPNWRVVTVVVPKTTAEAIREMERQAHADRMERTIADTSLEGAREVPVRRRRKKKAAAVGSPLRSKVGGVRIALGAEGLETKMARVRKTAGSKAAAPKSKATSSKKAPVKPQKTRTKAATRKARTKKKSRAR